MQLRDYQSGSTGVAGIYEAFARHKRVLYVCPTGGGKSVIIAEIVRRAIAKGSIVHLLVHRDKLLSQLRDRIVPLLPDDVEIGWVKSKKKLNPTAQVQLVSIQSWPRRKEHLPTPQLIITDEAHRGKANTYMAHQQYYPGAYSLGVTATPCTMAGAGLNIAYDTLVQGPQMLWLTEQKYLAPFEYLRFDPIISDCGPVGANGEFKLAKIGKKIKPSDYAPAAIAAYEKYIPGKQTLVFCIDVEHAHGVADAYNEAGIPSGAFTSLDTQEHNDAVLSRFLRGELLCLMSIEIFNEGVDIPALDAIQMLRPTDSLRIYLQQIGRAVRYVDGKLAYILDHVGNFERHGHPLAPRRWTLEGELGELERKALAKRPKKPPVQKQWEELGFSKARAQKLLALDESEYWVAWFNRVTAEIDRKGHKPFSLMRRIEKHHLDPPWAIFDAAGNWLYKKGAAKPGVGWHSYYRRYGYYPNDKPRKTKPDWQTMLDDLKPKLKTERDF